MPAWPVQITQSKTSVGTLLGGPQDNSVKAASKLPKDGTEAPLGVAQVDLPCHRPLKRRMPLGVECPSLRLQKRIDLQSLGLRRSDRIAKLQEGTKSHKAHVTFGTTVRKLITMYALVSTVQYDMPSHQIAPDSTYFQRAINRL